MIPSLRRFILLASLLVFFTGLEVQASEIPSQQGDIYVQDFAEVLTTQEEEKLLQLGHFLDSETKAQISVMTVDSLNEMPIEQYTNKAFREYKLGDEKENNGILFLVAVKDEMTRIEVGYGLEGALPDGKVGRILDEFAMPYLQEGKFSEAITNTYKVLYNEVAKEYELATDIKPIPYNANDASDELPISWIIIGIAVLIILIILDLKYLDGFLTFTIFLNLITSLLSRGESSSIGGNGGSSGGAGSDREW